MCYRKRKYNGNGAFNMKYVRRQVVLAFPHTAKESRAKSTSTKTLQSPEHIVVYTSPFLLATLIIKLQITGTKVNSKFC